MTRSSRLDVENKNCDCIEIVNVALNIVSRKAIRGKIVCEYVACEYDCIVMRQGYLYEY